MRDSFQRRLARALLSFGILVAPKHAVQWGKAMLGELGEVKGEWAALIWAAGGASVLLKHALLAFVLPGRNAPALLPNGGFFAKEGPMRNASLSIIGACIAAFLLSLLAPTFRQGLGVSLMQWRTTFTVTPHGPLPTTYAGFRVLAQEAERNHDAQGIAFAAVNIFEREERTRLAEEAVQLDPRLTWIYARAYPPPEKFESWVQKLKQWDPGNALPYFMEAMRNRKLVWQKGIDLQSEAWKNAMEGAFRSSKLDDYQQRLVELDLRVSARYDLHDPYVVARGIRYLPAIPYYDIVRFGESVVESGDKLKADGNLNGALEKYWSVIRFEEAVGVPTPELLKDACYKAAAVYEKMGNGAQAELLSYLAINISQAENEHANTGRQWLASLAVVDSEEAVIKISGLLLPVFGGLLLVCILVVIVRSRSLRPSALRTSTGTLAIGLASAVGLLLSSALVYVSYRPFAGIVQTFVSTGNDGGVAQLQQLLDYAQWPLLKPGPKYPIYFWMVVIGVGVLLLIVIAGRNLRFRPNVKPTV